MIVVLYLAACKQEYPMPDTGPSLETGWFLDSGVPVDSATACDDELLSTEPEAGQTGWYWRDPLTITTTSDARGAYAVRLLDDRGDEVAASLDWDATTGVRLAVTPDAPLSPSADYTLEVTDCRGPQEIPFSTSAYGTPLSVDPSSLVGRTFVFDMTQATWVQPEGFNTVLALYFTTPILTGVQWADASRLDLMGAQGRIDSDSGEVVQKTSEATWDYPSASFADSPYFQAYADELTIDISGAAVPVYGFSLAGTFSADATGIGGGQVSGLGDTRNMGPVINQGDDPNAVCDLAITVGVTCEPCPDGEPYCMFLSAVAVQGAAVDGLTLYPTSGT